MPLRAVANALLSAGNTTDVTQLRQPQVTGILPTQAGAPVFPNILPDRLPSTTLVSITTMDKDLQNAYSKQANIEVERALGGSRVLTVGYQYFRGENLLMSINQNVPTCVAAGTNNGCRPVSDLHEQQPVPGRRRRRTTTACTSPTCSGRRTGRPSASTYTLSKSMNNLGEAFFSSPTDPGQRDEGLGPLRQRPAAPARRQRLGQLADDARPRRRGSTSATASRPARCCRYYSSLPFNIVSGVNSLQGTAGRPFADGIGLDARTSTSARSSSFRATPARAATSSR